MAVGQKSLKYWINAIPKTSCALVSTHSLTHSLMYPYITLTLTHPFTHSLIHSLTHSLTFPPSLFPAPLTFTYSLTHLPPSPLTSLFSYFINIILYNIHCVCVCVCVMQFNNIADIEKGSTLVDIVTSATGVKEVPYADSCSSWGG
jgi:hypothetical protein